MKNILLFVLIGAALLLAWFTFGKKEEKKTTGTKPGNQDPAETPARIPANLQHIPVSKNTFQSSTGIIWEQLDKSKIDLGLGSNYTGNGEMEYYSGNGEIEYFGGVADNSKTPWLAAPCICKNGKKCHGAGKCFCCNKLDTNSGSEFTGNGQVELYTGTTTGIATKKPSCFSIWQWNVSNPNGPALPLWPGINCKNSNSIL